MSKERKDENQDKPEKARNSNKEDGCRCKEVSRKSLPELLKLLINDLAFWKKTKRN
jgi:hypothetical protein